jgi:hypothetical protein
MESGGKMLAVVVKRLVGGYSGQERYSIRKHPNGSFQAWHDNPYEGTNQSYKNDDLPLTGLFADAESVETELLRLRLIQS